MPPADPLTEEQFETAGYGAYYHWLRRRLARKGYLPRRLQPFLEWCAAPERAWLRVSDAAEFRHREFLDYLASEQNAHVRDLSLPNVPPAAK